MVDMPDEFAIQDPRWLWIEHDDERITHVSTFRRIYASHIINYNAREDYPQDNYCAHFYDANRTGVLVDNRHGAIKFYGATRLFEGLGQDINETGSYAIRFSSKINNLQNLGKTMMDFEKALEVAFALFKAGTDARYDYNYKKEENKSDIDKLLNGFTDAAKKRIYDNLTGDGTRYDLARALAISADISKNGIAHIMRERAGTILVSA